MFPESAPGAPPAVVTVTPGAMPWRAVESCVIGLRANSLVEMDETEPVRLTFFCVSYPTTTTSSRRFSSGSREMLSVVCLPIFTSFSLNPRKVTTRVSPSATGSVN